MSDGSVQLGYDPSRKDLLGYTTNYWVSTDKLRDWLADWDAWEAAKPAWFLMKNRAFEKRMLKYAPAEALPRTPLLNVLAKATDGKGNPLRVPPEAEIDWLVAEVQKHRRARRGRARARHSAEGAKTAKGASAGKAKVSPSPGVAGGA